MAFSPKGVMDIVEIAARWHADYSISGVSEALGVDRKTVRRYVRAVEKAGLSRDGPLPDRETLVDLLLPLVATNKRATPVRGQFDRYREEIIELVTRTTDPLKAKTAYEVICTRHSVGASYSSFKRFMRHLAPQLSPRRSTCRIEVDPGAEIQVDYGKVGLLYDPDTGRNRVVYVFAGTLSHSRYKYLEFVFTQNQQSFAASHVRMLAHFGGVSRTLIIDNLKSGVLKPDLYDPELNPLYRDLATHCGFFVDTARVGVPTDKGKIERVIPLARELFRKLKTLHTDLDLAAANRHALAWCRTGNGMTIHGTTGERPAEAFRDREAAALSPLPTTPFEIAVWKKVTVHPDQYIQFEKKPFSLPERFVGRVLWARGTEKMVMIYDLQFRLVRQFVRSSRHRTTVWSDFPENVTLMLADGAVIRVIRQAAAIGPSMEAYVTRVLEPHAKINLRRAMGLVGLADRYAPAQLEVAAATALEGGLFRHNDFKRLLLAGPTIADEPIPMSEETASFVRDASYFIHSTPTPHGT